MGDHGTPQEQEQEQVQEQEQEQREATGGNGKQRETTGGNGVGSNRCILRVDRDCVARIPRAYAVAMALPSPRPQAGWPNAARREQREEGREQKSLQLHSLHIYGVPWPGRKSSENQKSPPAQIHSIFTVSRDHVEKRRKVLERTFAQNLKSRGCFEEARQADSLHIYGVS